MRIGYLARGITFLVVGAFAFLAAGGFGANPHSLRRALELLFQPPLSGYFLWTLAAGLLCFAGWRFHQCVFDADCNSGGFHGLVNRIMLGGSGVLYVALAVATTRATTEQQRMSEGQQAREWAQWLIGKPLGRGLIALIAAGFVGVGIGLAVKAFRSPSYLKIDAAKSTRILAAGLASYGTLIRAILFLIIGGYLMIAAYDSDSKEAMSIGGVLRAIQNQSYGGGMLLGIAALGLLAFGTFEIIEAIARRPNTSNRLPSPRHTPLP